MSSIENEGTIEEFEDSEAEDPFKSRKKISSIEDDGVIEEFEDSEDPFSSRKQQSIGVEVVDKDEFDFLSGASELATLQAELYDVRGELALSKSNGQYIPLKLYRSHCHNSLSVSDIQSGIWCERQLEYRYLYPHMKKTNQWLKQEKEGKEIKKKTPAMLKGSTIHQIKELEVHEQIPVRTVTQEDKHAVQLLNTYNQLAIIKQGKFEREIAVFGDPLNTGILLKGIIDQVQYSTDTHKLKITDLKTRITKSLPGETQILGHKFQVMAYKMLLDGLTRGSTQMNLLYDHLNLNPNSKLSVGVTDYIAKIGMENAFDKVCNAGEHGVSFREFMETVCTLITRLDLPPVSSLVISYEHQGTKEVLGTEEVVFDEAWVKETIETAIGFWKGDREPTGPDIEDLWKCDSCQFKGVCVWTKQKSLEASPAAKKNY